jgi:hypothetical protein
MILSSLIGLWLALQQTAPAAHDVGPKQAGNVNLTLQCGSSSGIRFTIANTGSVDTTLWLGAGLGNGSKYMISDLKLAVRAPAQAAEIYRYSPYHYPSGIAGRLDDWLQALPVRSEFALTATPDDFLSNDRPKSFPRGSRLALTLVVPEPRSQLLMLKYWAGTLTSNTCIMN